MKTEIYGSGIHSVCKNGQNNEEHPSVREATVRPSAGKGREGIREGLSDKCNVLFLSGVGDTSVWDGILFKCLHI